MGFFSPGKNAYGLFWTGRAFLSSLKLASHSGAARAWCVLLYGVADMKFSFSLWKKLLLLQDPVGVSQGCPGMFLVDIVQHLLQSQLPAGPQIRK